MPVTAETIEKLLRRIDELLASVKDLTKRLEEARQQHEIDVAKMDALEKKIEELTTRKVKKDSHNSSMPPSSDGYAKPAPKSLREKSGKKAGGQIGHKGSGMQIKMEPTEVRQYLPGQCSGCPNEGKCTYTCTGTHYVYDIYGFPIILREYDVFLFDNGMHFRQRSAASETLLLFIRQRAE